MITDELRSASDEQILRGLEFADPMGLRAVLYHATQDESLKHLNIDTVHGTYGPVKTITDPDDRALIKRKSFELLTAYRDGKREPPSGVDERVLFEAVRLAVGADIPDEDMALHIDMLSLDAKPDGWGQPPARVALEDFEVIVIGSGLAGTNAAIQLKASGIKYRLLDKNGGPGGTWYQNRYPGARVDWPCFLYSHSFGTEFPFSYPYPPQKLNEEYINWAVDRFGVREDMQFNTEVIAMTWNEDDGRWHVRCRLSDGSEQTYSANAVISAIGLLERPRIPAIPGLETFTKPNFHTARFDNSIDYSDKHVVVIGSGASGLQMVPDLARIAKHVTVFQRTPPWVLPVPGYRDPLPEDLVWLAANCPYYANWNRLIYSWYLGDFGIYDVYRIDPDWKEPGSVNALNAKLREVLENYLTEKLGHRPDLYEKCKPTYPVYGTRPIPDNGWFDAILTDKVSIVAEGAARFTEDAVISSSGVEVKPDVVVFATGFNPNDYYSKIDIRGRDGISIDEVWAKDGPRAYWAITVPKMPNLFILYGPNGNPANLGPVQYGEWAMKYFLQCFRAMVENGWKSMEIKQEEFAAHNAELDKRLATMINAGPPEMPKSYYSNEFGRSAVQSPWTSAEVREQLKEVDFSSYSVESVKEPVT